MKQFSDFYNRGGKDVELETRFRMPAFFTTEDQRNRWNQTLSYYKSKFDGEITSESYKVNYYENNVRSRGDTEIFEEKKEIFSYSDDEIYTKYSISSEKKVNKPSGGILEERNISRVSLKFEKFVIDFSIVKVKNEIKYEIEVEWKGGKDDSAVRDLENEALGIYKNVMGTKLLYKNSERNRIIYQLNKLLPNISIVKKKVVGLALFGQKTIDLRHEDITAAPGGYFEKEVFISHKVDGFKESLLVMDGNVYLINGQIINWISDTYQGKGTFFLDGEVYGENLYYPFDVFYSENVKMEDNYSKKLDFIRSLNNHRISNYTIQSKSSYSLKEDFYKVMQLMFKEQERLSYKQDGFVFTPNETSFRTVEGYFLKETRKWKPAKNMTIDFQLQKDKSVYFLTVMNKSGKIERFKPEGKEFYIPVSFCKDYVDGDVVECLYNTFLKRFEIVRKRADEKPTPDPIHQALIIWNLVFRPITKDHLTGNDIDAMRNYHRDNKKKIISKMKELSSKSEEYYVNPHTRNCIEDKIEYTDKINEDWQSENFTYLSSSYTNILRNKVLLAIEFIYQSDFEHTFCIIGLDKFIDSSNLIKQTNGKIPRIVMIRKNSDFPKNTKISMISFAADKNETNLQYYGFTEMDVESYLIQMNVSKTYAKYFINYKADKIMYPVCDGTDLYISCSQVSKVETQLFETSKYKNILNYYNKFIRRAKYDKVDSFYFDDCYSCKREMEIYKSTGDNGDDVTKDDIFKPGYFHVVDELIGENINQNLISSSNSALDIGIGRAPARWIESGYKVLGLEPNYDNFTELMKRLSKRFDPNLYPVNLGIMKDYDLLDVKDRLGNLKIGCMVSFDSLTFFYENEDKIKLLIKFIEENITEDGFFGCVALDTMKLISQYDPSKVKKFYLKRLDERKINVSLGKDSIVSDQIEYIISFEDFIMRMEGIGFKVVEDYYLDKEKLLTFDEYLYSSSTRCIIFQKQKPIFI